MVEIIPSHIFICQRIVFGVAAVLLLAAAEIGFRFGLPLRLAKEDARKGQISAIQGAMLGLLSAEHRTAIENQLRRHVAVRLEFYAAGEEPPAEQM